MVHTHRWKEDGVEKGRGRERGRVGYPARERWKRARWGEVWGFDSTDNASGSSQEIHGRGGEINVLLHLHSYLSGLHILSFLHSLLFRFYIRPLPQSGRDGQGIVHPSLFEEILAQTCATRTCCKSAARQILGMEDVLRILEGFQVLGRSGCYFGMAVLALSIDFVDQGRVTWLMDVIFFFFNRFWGGLFE